MSSEKQYEIFLLAVFLLGFVFGGAVSSTVQCVLDSIKRKRQREEE